MKKIIFAIPVMLVLFLSACSSAAPATESNASSASSTQVTDLVNQSLTASAPVATQVSTNTGTVVLSTAYDNAVSVEMQLLLGSIKLEGTDLKVTEEQANILLPLWINFQNLSQSMMPARGDMGQGQPNSTPQPQTVDTAAQAQIDEIMKQIQSSMQPEQINAIAAMQITQETAQTIMQEQGLTMGNPQQGSGVQQLQGDMPQGTPPAGGPSGQPPSGGQMGTPPDGGMQKGGMIPTELMNMFIQLLQGKIAS